MKPDPTQFKGLTVQEARALLGEERRLRMASQDGVPYVLTQDYNPNRLNVHLVNGRITKASYG